MAMECGVFGFPLEHSISSVFQQAAFDFEGLDVTYRPWPVSPDQFPVRLQELREPRFLGANVTIPHKEAALRGVDEADPVARAVGAVNTVVRRGGELRGSNTDVPGFLDLLARECRESPSGQAALVLGAGGAARAVSLALALAGARRLVLANRSPDRARRLGEHLASISRETMDELRARLASHLRALDSKTEGTPSSASASRSVETSPGRPAVDVVAWHGDAFREAVRACRFVVNCTSAGMLGSQQDVSPLPAGAALHPDAIVIDVVANPIRTRLMAEAERAGRRAIGGLPMLIYQGAESFTIWTGREAPLEVMREAALAHMRGRAR